MRVRRGPHEQARLHAGRDAACLQDDADDYLATTSMIALRSFTTANTNRLR